MPKLYYFYHFCHFTADVAVDCRSLTHVSRRSNNRNKTWCSEHSPVKMRSFLGHSFGFRWQGSAQQAYFSEPTILLASLSLNSERQTTGRTSDA
jgi:hypothetical protein